MNKSNHPVEQEEVMAYLDGELSTDRAFEVVSHLERCLECQEVAADLQNVSKQLTSWQVGSASARIEMGVAAALEWHDRQPRSSPVVNRQRWQDFFRKRGFSRWGWGFAGVGLVLLLISTARLDFPRKEIVAVSPSPPKANVMFNRAEAEDTTEFLRQQLADATRKLAKGAAGNGSGVPTQGQMIVRTATLTLTTKDFDQAHAALEGILRREGGYVDGLNLTTRAGAARTLTATLRVPFDQFETTLTELRKLGRVESESQKGEDVTSQYVDLNARLSNARNTEKRLTDLLRQRTGELAYVLQVELEIDRVRGEIEQMEAERKNLAHQVNFATINATFTEDYQAQLQIVPLSTSTRFRNAAVQGYRTMVEGIVDTILFLVSYLPSALLCAALLFFPIRGLWRKLRQRQPLT